MAIHYSRKDDIEELFNRYATVDIKEEGPGPNPDSRQSNTKNQESKASK